MTNKYLEGLKGIISFLLYLSKAVRYFVCPVSHYIAEFPGLSGNRRGSRLGLPGLDKEELYIQSAACGTCLDMPNRNLEGREPEAGIR